jgi:hypothetical protein
MMPVQCPDGSLGEATAAIWDGVGEVYILRDGRVPVQDFMEHYKPFPERRTMVRRSLDRRRNRKVSRRQSARRVRDCLTEREIFELARGIQYVTTGWR